MRGDVGDTIIVESEKATQAERQGTIEEVLEAEPPRYRVKWTDGRTSILVPEAGATRVVPKRAAGRRR